MRQGTTVYSITFTLTEKNCFWPEENNTSTSNFKTNIYICSILKTYTRPCSLCINKDVKPDMNTYIIEKATVLFVAHSFTLLTDEGSCRQKRTIYTIKSIIDNEHDKYYVIIYKLYVLELECTLFSLMLFFW